MWVSVILIASGVFHFLILILNGAPWNGPLSPRKPALFGLSTGLTAWSITWVMTRIRQESWDSVLARLLGIGLMAEVSLITLQYWRGVPSHFNYATVFDTTIEQTMLAIILLVTLAICYLTYRTLSLRPVDEAMALAIRAGMLFLCLSCVAGIFSFLLGGTNIANGKSYEFWGKAGVLKFPHGVTLHAIQILPALAWLTKRLKIDNSTWLVASLAASQALFLLYAIWQTSNGRARFEYDLTGAILLAGSAFFGFIPVINVFLTVSRSTLSRMHFFSG